MVIGAQRTNDEVMSRLFSPQNRPHFVVIFVAFVARVLLGGIPLVGGLLSLGLLLVILFHVYRVATNLMKTSPAT